MRRLSGKKQFWILYTAMFVAVMGVILAMFAIKNRSLIHGYDGLRQHAVALGYLGEYIRTGLSGGGWKMVDFSLGQGLDVLTTLTYYCFTEPLSLIAAVFPLNRTELVYALLTVVRLYLAGAFAGMLAKYWDAEDWSAAVGALTYALSSFALGGVFKHFNFGPGMMFLPLLILMTEHVFREGKCGGYVAVAALMVVSNYYFAFMNTIILIVYIVVRLAQLLMGGEKVRECAKMGFRLLGGYLLALALSAVVLLPVAYAFMQNGRIGTEVGEVISLWHYSLDYYATWAMSFFGMPIAVGAWNVTGFIPLTAFALAFLLKEKGNGARSTLTMLALLTAMLCIPAMGQFMNGMSYATNRWSYAFALFVALAMAMTLPDVIACRSKKMAAIGLACCLYAFAALLYGRNWAALVSLLLFAATVALFGMNALVEPKWLTAKRMRGAVCLLTMTSVLLQGVLHFSPLGNRYLREFQDNGSMAEAQTDRMAVFEDLDDEFYRVANVEGENTDRRHLQDSYAPFVNYRGVGFYWSLVPSWVSSYYAELYSGDMRMSFNISTLGADAGLNELASVRYMLRKSDVDVLPMGYEAIRTEIVEDDATYEVLENRYALPVGYTFDSYMTEEVYEALSAAEKRDALMRAAVVEIAPEGMAEADAKTSLTKLDYGTQIDIVENGVRLRCELPERGEVLVVVPGVRADETREEQSRYVTVKGVSGEAWAIIEEPGSQFNFGQQGVIISMGVCEAGSNEFEFVVDGGAAFVCDGVELYFRSEADYVAQAEALAADVLEDVEVGTNRLEGAISLDERKWLQLSIPYSDGWMAEVDGEPAELSVSGGMYMGLPLEAGEHEIVLKYETPMLRAGAYVTLAALVVCGILMVIRRKKRG